MPVFFNGQLLVTPTVQSLVDDSQMFNRNLTVGNIVALIGRSEGGEPKVPLVLRSPSHAKKVLRDGELLTAVRKAFAPSNATHGPSRIVAMRVNPAVQAELTLVDGSAGDAIDLKATDYGIWTNQIKVKVESGTTSGKRLTTQVGNAYFSKDNVARSAFTVTYTGAQVTATVTVSNTQILLHAPALTLVATIELSAYDTVQEVVDRINVTTGFSATVTAGSANTATLNGLDAVAAASCKTPTVYDVRADLQACIDWFNGFAEGFITATRPAAASKVPANLAFTYLTGGSNGTVTNTDWDDCFVALESEDVQWVVPVAGDASIHAMADAHVHFMSGVGKRERRAFVGGDLGLTQSSAAAAAATINSDRTAYCYPGMYDYDSAGVLTLYAPYILAAQVAGGFGGVNPGTPLTNKPLTVRGMELDLKDPADTDFMIDSGVLCVTKSPKQDYRVVKSISTWLSDSKYNRVEVSTGAATDFVARNVREALQDFIGAKGSPESLHAIASRTDSILAELARPEPAGPGVIVGDLINPPYRNITVELEGDVVRVEFECSPVIPINYVLVTIHAVPYSGRV